jgi:hypothetical protein
MISTVLASQRSGLCTGQTEHETRVTLQQFLLDIGDQISYVGAAIQQLI